MDEVQFLNFIRNRLVHVYQESPMVDFILKLDDIIRQKAKYDPIVAEFDRVDRGLVTNVIFSDANVVMLSKEHFDALTDAADSAKYDTKEDKKIDEQTQSGKRLR